MRSRTRLGAAALLALFAVTGLCAGTAGADPRPAPDRSAGGDPAASVSERRSAVRATEQKRAEPRPRCHRRESECGLGAPIREPDDLESPSDGGDGGAFPGTLLPDWTFRPPQAPPRVPPPLDEPSVPDVVDVVPGVGLPLTSPVGAPIAVPLLPVVPGVVAPRTGGAGGAPRPETPPPRPATPVPSGPRAPETPAALSNSPASVSAQRVGYAEYLRGAGLPQIAAVALPGVAGILVLTGAGGLVGYRHAKAGRAVAVRPVARFMN